MQHNYSVLIYLNLLLLGACTSNSPEAAKPPSAAAQSQRLLQNGAVIGFENASHGHSWLGLPYAAPPVGALRWEPPQPTTDWPARREALHAGSPCIQFGSTLGGVGSADSHQGSEDCLYLNVYAPRLSESQANTTRLPVMLWIHGGGNTTGEAAFYDGSVLATRENVIVVMINYRLGPFGWFVLPNINLSNKVGPVNFGNLDSIAALRWVQNNIDKFGGDPKNITVFGESAGGTNTLALLITPSAKGLFNKVIIQSLGFGFSSLETATERSTATIQRLLRKQNKEDLHGAAVVDFLRNLDPWIIYEAYGDPNLEMGVQVPSAIQDNSLIKLGDPLVLLADPQQHIDVPVMLGTNRDETKLFMAFDSLHTVQIAGFPLWIRNIKSYERESHYRSLLWKADGVDSLAEKLSLNNAQTFTYRFDWDEQGVARGVLNVSRILGAAHGMEVPFVLGNFNVGPQSNLLYSKENEASRLKLSAEMMSYWTQFARTGNPERGGKGDLVHWKPWSVSKINGSLTVVPQLLIFDTTAGGGIRIINEQVSRREIVQQMSAEPLNEVIKCALFKSTFRNRQDLAADAAWQNFLSGRCKGPRFNSMPASE